MRFPTYEEMAKDVAEKALDEYVYQGKTLREWIQIILESQDEDCISRKEVLIKDLSERVENIERKMEEDKEERLKKLEAELEYAKFRCTL